jgi:hypothetical protein
MKHEYEMTSEQHETLLEACKPVPAMYLSGGQLMGNSPQENANEAWRKLGLELGFDHLTVEPVSGKPPTFFRAETKADPIMDGDAETGCPDDKVFANTDIDTIRDSIRRGARRTDHRFKP